jgi:hypothetical protein
VLPPSVASLHAHILSEHCREYWEAVSASESGRAGAATMACGCAWALKYWMVRRGLGRAGGGSWWPSAACMVISGVNIVVNIKRLSVHEGQGWVGLRHGTKYWVVRRRPGR